MIKIRKKIISGLVGLIGLGLVPSISLGGSVTPMDLKNKIINSPQTSIYSDYSSQDFDNYYIIDNKLVLRDGECTMGAETMENESISFSNLYTSISCVKDKKSLFLYFVDKNSDGLKSNDTAYFRYVYPDNTQFEINLDFKDNSYLQTCVRNSKRVVCGHGSEKEIPWFLRERFDKTKIATVNVLESAYNEFLKSAYDEKMPDISKIPINEASERIKPLVDSVLEKKGNVLNLAINLAKEYEKLMTDNPEKNTCKTK